MRYLMLVLLLLALPVQAADYAREKSWADEITPTLVVGDAIYLEAQGHKFLALYTEAEQPKGAVILVHGIGVHPDWGLIGVLRSQLPDARYATLSLQMPVLAAAAKPDAYPPTFPEAAARIAAAIAYLQSKGYKHIALVSHSLGSRMADYYLAHHADTPAQAWVAIGMGAPFTSTSRIRIPVLDLYGANDLAPVKASAAARAKAIKRLPHSRQVRVAGSDHFFNGHDAELVKTVSGFLDGLDWSGGK